MNFSFHLPLVLGALAGLIAGCEAPGTPDHSGRTAAGGVSVSSVSAGAVSVGAMSVGEWVQDDAHPPHSWRLLSADEQATFDLGYAVFNTEWVPANSPAGKIDGLGPLFNSQGCDACHNSRRRGRGPRGDGPAPSDLVMQLGRVLPDGRVQRGTKEYGAVLNTAAIKGFAPEGNVLIRYEDRVVSLDDGAKVTLHFPRYRVERLSNAPLPEDTALMPRMPPTVMGDGLLEDVPDFDLRRLVEEQARAHGPVHGRISVVDASVSVRGTAIGRFGWQGTEPSVESQIAHAFAREMGLTNRVVSQIDCGDSDAPCRNAAVGGSPEVEEDLFDAVVKFQRLHAVPVESLPDTGSPGARRFEQSGCAECHRFSLPLSPQPGLPGRTEIHPFTDLLLHDMGVGLADRDIQGGLIQSAWRTAPLWGLHASVVSGQPLRLIHDGRARSIEEAILWHDGEARAARERFMHLSAMERQSLVEWLSGL